MVVLAVSIVLIQTTPLKVLLTIPLSVTRSMGDLSLLRNVVVVVVNVVDVVDAGVVVVKITTPLWLKPPHRQRIMLETKT
jgi:hypothetical protein